ncbi:MAG: mechanosensitive ion channel [Gemmatimonadetes bacterium]|nr:mechanosensitive ion channel [Gemmatimonadota bacterium]
MTTAELRDMIGGAFDDALSAAISFSPRLLAALGLVVLGLVVGWVVEWAVAGLLRRVGFDKLIRKTGVLHTLLEGREQDARLWIGRLLRIGVILITLQVALEIVGLRLVSESIRSAVGYVPSLLSAIILFVLGGYVATAVSRILKRLTVGLGEGYSTALGRMAAALIYIVVTAMALSQLRLEAAVLQLVITCVVASLCFGLALAFALGSRDVMRNVLAGFYARKLLRSGDEIDMHGQKGTLVSITPTQTVIETKNALKLVPNEVYLSEVVEKRR